MNLIRSLLGTNTLIYFTILFIIGEYGSLFFVIYREKIREKRTPLQIVLWAMGLAFLGTLGVSQYGFHLELTGFIMALIAVYSVYSLRLFKCIQYYVVAFLIVSLFTSTCEFIFEMMWNQLISFEVLFHGVAIIICWIYYILFGRYTDREAFALNGNLGIWLTIQYLVITLMVTNYQYILRDQVIDKTTRVAGGILAGVGGILLSLSYFVLLFFINQKRRSQDKIRTMELRGEIERNHFMQLLKKEDETRKFRHDYTASMIVLKEYLESGNIDMAKKFLNQLENSLSSNIYHTYTVGDNLIDAILNYYLINDGSIKISVSGALISHGKIIENDLTILISNLVRNAVEEVSLQEIKDRFINIEFFQSEQILRVTINNSLDPESTLKKNNRKSKGVLKGHVEHQGIGLLKVDETVRKYGGSFYYIDKGNVFEAGFTIPMKESNN